MTKLGKAAGLTRTARRGHRADQDQPVQVIEGQQTAAHRGTIDPEGIGPGPAGPNRAHPGPVRRHQTAIKAFYSAGDPKGCPNWLGRIIGVITADIQLPDRWNGSSLH